MFHVKHRLMHAQSEDGGAATPSDDLRSTIESAMDQAEKPSTPAPEPTRPDPPDGVPRAGETPQQTADRVRDERGRFAAAAKTAEKPVAGSVAEAVAQAQGQPETPPATAQEAPKLDPPRSWNAVTRERWGSLPPEVQQEVLRRERDHAKMMQETAPARQVYDHLSRMQQEFAPALQAEGVDVVTASRNLMGMVSRLRFGMPQERAAVIAGLVQAYGVDIEALDATLAGQPVQHQQQQFQDPRVDQLLGALQQSQEQRIQTVRAQAHNEVNQFGQGKDFFDDVREDMADILELASRRGIDMTLDQAYERAVNLHPDVSRVVAQRTAAAQAQNPSGSTARAKLASSSIRSTPAVPPAKPAPEGNLRDSLYAAWDQAQENRR